MLVERAWKDESTTSPLTSCPPSPAPDSITFLLDVVPTGHDYLDPSPLTTCPLSPAPDPATSVCFEDVSAGNGESDLSPLTTCPPSPASGPTTSALKDVLAEHDGSDPSPRTFCPPSPPAPDRITGIDKVDATFVNVSQPLSTGYSGIRPVKISSAREVMLQDDFTFAIDTHETSADISSMQDEAYSILPHADDAPKTCSLKNVCPAILPPTPPSTSSERSGTPDASDVDIIVQGAESCEIEIAQPLNVAPDKEERASADLAIPSDKVDTPTICDETSIRPPLQAARRKSAPSLAQTTKDDERWNRGIRAVTAPSSSVLQKSLTQATDVIGRRLQPLPASFVIKAWKPLLNPPKRPRTPISAETSCALHTARIEQLELANIRLAAANASFSARHESTVSATTAWEFTLLAQCRTDLARMTAGRDFAANELHRRTSESAMMALEIVELRKDVASKDALVYRNSVEIGQLKYQLKRSGERAPSVQVPSQWPPAESPILIHPGNWGPTKPLTHHQPVMDTDMLDPDSPPLRVAQSASELAQLPMVNHIYTRRTLHPPPLPPMPMHQHPLGNFPHSMGPPSGARLVIPAPTSLAGSSMALPMANVRRIEMPPDLIQRLQVAEQQAGYWRHHYRGLKGIKEKNEETLVSNLQNLRNQVKSLGGNPCV